MKSGDLSHNEPTLSFQDERHPEEIDSFAGSQWEHSRDEAARACIPGRSEHLGHERRCQEI